MPLPGGAADKLGNRYEGYWTVYCLLDVLEESAVSLRVEPLDVDPTGIEFWLKRPERLEFHQAKRQQSVSDRWSISALRDRRVLQTAFEKLRGNDDSFHFASLQDALELRELCERARSAVELTEFERHLSDPLRKAFADIVAISGTQDKSPCYLMLKRIFPEAISESTLRRTAETRLARLVVGNSAAAFSALADLIEDRVHQEIDAPEVWRHLYKLNFARQFWLQDSSILVATESVNKTYIANLRDELINQVLIPKVAEFVEFTDWLHNGQQMLLALVGAAGIGKSSFVLQIVNLLKDNDIPNLAFRVDRLPSVLSPKQIGEKLGIAQSPALVLSGLSTKRVGILVIDQVDAVSLASGRQPEMFEVIRALIDEAEALKNLRVVFVCRRFDVENDHRIRAITSNEIRVRTLELSALDDSDVQKIVSDRGFNYSELPKSLHSLLKTPLHLKLFVTVARPGGDYSRLVTEQDLFDAFWDHEQRTLRRKLHDPTNWSRVLESLAKLCSEQLSLSVPVALLDEWQMDAELLVSEGVLRKERDRIAFFHETFFDYCFARAFLRAQVSWPEYLIRNGQQLFRRAQTRQVLAHLRDFDRASYIRQLEVLLSSPEIRYHIKQVVLAVTRNLSNPMDEEWAVLSEVLKSNDRWMIEEVWNVFLHFPWFDRLYAKGAIGGWCQSSDAAVLDRVTWLLRAMQRDCPNEVAALLATRVGISPEWDKRLAWVIQLADIDASRPFFDLFLTLYDAGTIDDVRGPIAINSTFWDLTYGVSDKHPDWACEIVEHYLQRLVPPLSANNSTVSGHDLFPDAHGFQELVTKGAQGAPVVFVDRCLPLTLQILDKGALESESDELVHDSIWHTPTYGEHYFGTEKFLAGLEFAFAYVASNEAPKFISLLHQLQDSKHYIVQYLLEKGLAAGGARFAESAADHLIRKPSCLNISYSSASAWVSRELVEKICSQISKEKYVSLEKAILNFYPASERSAGGQRWRGTCQFTLLSAIPNNRLTSMGKKRLAEWQRKFGQTQPPGPHALQGGFIPSPIPDKAVDRMTDDQWLSAIRRYGSENDAMRSWSHLVGGAHQLSQQLEAITKTDPRRFASLLLRFPLDAHPYYFDAVLRGLAEAQFADVPLLERVCQHCHSIPTRPCGRWIGRPMSKLTSVGKVPSEAMLDILCWYAINDPDPDQEVWRSNAKGGTPYYGGDIMTAAINSVRGAVAEEIGTLVFDQPSRAPRFLEVIEKMVEDPSVAVRSCVAKILLAMLNWDRASAVNLFLKLADTEDILLSTHYVDRFVYYAMSSHFDVLRPVIARALSSDVAPVRHMGARHLAIASLDRSDLRSDVEQCFTLDVDVRKGLALVFAANLKTARFRDYCVGSLIRLLADPDQEVRKEATTWLRNTKKGELDDLNDLLVAHIDGPSFAHDTFWLMEHLIAITRPDPSVVFRMADRFIKEFGTEGGDLRTARPMEAEKLVVLILRVYAQTLDQNIKSACLDRIDKMVQLRYYRLEEQLALYER